MTEHRVWCDEIGVKREDAVLYIGMAQKEAAEKFIEQHNNKNKLSGLKSSYSVKVESVVSFRVKVTPMYYAEFA